MNNAAIANARYEKIKAPITAFFQNLPGLNTNKYIKANAVPAADFLSATLEYLGASFRVRFYILPPIENIRGVLCVYLSEGDAETLVHKYIFDYLGNVLVEGDLTSMQNIQQNTFPDELLIDIANAYLSEMAKRFDK
jgi:hypothetical protein